MDFIDYYKVLEIGKDASADEIKKAYRKLARKLLELLPLSGDIFKK